MDLNERLLVACFVFAFMLSEIRALASFPFGCTRAALECPNEHISFFLYNREHAVDPIELSVGNSKAFFKANFAENRPLVILIHGYTGHRDFSPNTQIRPAYLKHADYNIISVDYKTLAAKPCYITAVSNLKTVANCTAQLIDFLIDGNIFDLDAIHVIGFSLGGQTAGMIANYLKANRKLKRITGLDPAKPLFIRAPNEGRLDSGDAEFVDIIHTDIFQRGVLVPSGHVDFYVNGGFDQPGCYQQKDISPGSCNHDRAPTYFAESIESEPGFWGFRCAHWYLYALGFCQEEESDFKAEMGFKTSNESRGLYFLTTNADSPYARGDSFANNTVVPVESIEISESELEDAEIIGQVDNTL